MHRDNIHSRAFAMDNGNIVWTMVRLRPCVGCVEWVWLFLLFKQFFKLIEDNLFGDRMAVELGVSVRY